MGVSNSKSENTAVRYPPAKRVSKPVVIEYVDPDDERFFVTFGNERVNARTNALVDSNIYSIEDGRTVLETHYVIRGNPKKDMRRYTCVLSLQPHGDVQSVEFVGRLECDKIKYIWLEKWDVAQKFCNNPKFVLRSSHPSEHSEARAPDSPIPDETSTGCSAEPSAPRAEGEEL